MKIARNLVNRTTPIALPGRSVYLEKLGSEGPLTNDEAKTGPVNGLKRTRKISLRNATDQDKANYPDFDETPNAEALASQRRRTQLNRAQLRASGKA